MLCLWLPFTDGTTKNQGLIQDGITTGVTPTFINDGKLGKCLNQGQIDMSADTTAKILNNQELTICFWLYVNAEKGSTTKRGMLFGNDSMGENSNRKFSLFQYPTCNDLHLSWMNDTKDKAFLAEILKGILPSYQWTHVTITYDNPTTSIYINGIKKYTCSGISNSSSFAYNTRVVWNNAYRYLNDFRIYNTCLSPRQVKEISKGLVCHYTLGEVDGKIGGRNLIKNGKGNVKAGFFKNFPTVTNEYAEFTLKSKKTYAIINLSDGFVYGCRDYPVGEKYTWSYDIMYTAWNFPTGSNRGEFWMGQRYANAPSGETATGAWRNVTLHNLPVVGQNGYELNKWYHVKQTVTIPQQASSNVGQHGAISFYNSNANVEASFTARIKNIKLEKSSTATPWTPAPEDDASFYDNVIYDTSGYGNNGSVTDSTCPTWSSDTPRYKGSYVFNGNNQYLKFQNPITSSSTDFTISCWVKFDDTTGNSTICTMRTAVGNGIALFKIGNKIRFDDNAQFTFSDYTISANAWTHVVVTRLSSCKKLYVNGILKQTVNTVGDMKLISNVGTIGASSQGGDGISNYLNGQLSDLRIYATALSDSDIFELYQSSASVDNNGNLMLAGEVMEE